MESCLRLDFFNDLQEPPDDFFEKTSRRWVKTKRHPDGTESHPKS